MEAVLNAYPVVWQLLYKIDWAREMSYNAGFLDIRSLEKTHLTYFKCIDLSREVNYPEFVAKGFGPFDYDVLVNSELAKVGKTSFQLDHQIVHAPSDTTLFTSSLVIVCVDRNSRQVCQIPEWWVDKYKPLSAKNPNTLRVDFRDIESGSTPVTQLSIPVLPSHIDYYGHTNNSVYMRFAHEGILNALNQGKINERRKFVESAVKNIQVDFISDSNVGDSLETLTWQDCLYGKTFWSKLLLAGSPIYAQKVTLEY
jgi:acyl-CoA thioesterase FadM